MMLRIPLFPYPQRFEIELGGQAFVFEVVWNDVLSLWVMSISRAEDDSSIVVGVPMLPNKNLLSQFRHIGFPGELWVLNNGRSEDTPSERNLGLTSNLYFVEAA